MTTVGHFRRLVRSNILGAEQYSAIVDQSSVQLFDSAEFYHQAMRIKYSIEWGNDASLDS